MGSNPTKLTTDFTNDKNKYCRLVTESQFLRYMQFIIIEVKPMHRFCMRYIIGCGQLGELSGSLGAKFIDS